MNRSVFSISIDSELAEAARQYGKAFNRSMDEQLELWAQIGRVLMETTDFSIRPITKVLRAFDEGDFPEHPHRRVASMEAAVDVVGMRIAELSAQLYDCRKSDAADKGRIAEILNKISRLRELQEDLEPGDTERVEAILAGNIPIDGGSSAHS